MGDMIALEQQYGATNHAPLPVVLSRGAIHAAGPYRCDNIRIAARAMLTNTPPNGAFRGFGAPQTQFLHYGDRVRIAMNDAQGRSIFGAIEQEVVRG